MISELVFCFIYADVVVAVVGCWVWHKLAANVVVTETGVNSVEPKKLSSIL